METCRVCLNTNQNIHSVWDMGSDRRINELLVKHLDLQINADENLPQCICCNCLNILENTNTLRRNSKRNEAILFRQNAPVGAPNGYHVPIPQPTPIYVQQQPHFTSFYPYQPQPMFVYAPQQVPHQLCTEQPTELVQPCPEIFSNHSPALSPRCSRSHVNLRDELSWKRSSENSDTEGTPGYYSSSEPEGEEKTTCPKDSDSENSLECRQYRRFTSMIPEDDASTEINYYPANENIERAREDVARADQEIAFMIGLGHS